MLSIFMSSYPLFSGFSFICAVYEQTTSRQIRPCIVRSTFVDIHGHVGDVTFKGRSPTILSTSFSVVEIKMYEAVRMCIAQQLLYK